MSEATPTTSPAGRADPGGYPSTSAVAWKPVARAALQRVKSHDLPSLAAGIAFRMFLSLFPALLAAIAVVSYVVEDPLAVARDLRPFLPPGFVSDLLEERLMSIAQERGTAAVALVGGALGGLWAASSAAVTLIRALNRINGVPERRGFVAQRSVGLLLVLGLLAVLVVVMALVVLGPQLRALVMPPQLGMLGSLLFSAAQTVVVLATLMLLFAFIYWIGPEHERSRWRWLSPGSVVAVVGWLVLSLAFRLFVQTLGNYEETYGSLATVALTMVWLQLSMMVVLLGAEIDVEIASLGERAQSIAEGVGAGVVEPPVPQPAAAGAAAGMAAGSPQGRTTTGTVAERAARGSGATENTPAPLAAGVPTVDRHGELRPAEATGPGGIPRTTAALAGLGALAAAVVWALRARAGD